MDVATCRSKTARGNVYGTLAEASQVAARVSSQAGHRIRAFRCRHCGAYHIGRQSRDGRLRRNR